MNQVTTTPHPQGNKIIDKFPVTHQIVEMLKHFECHHNKDNQILGRAGRSDLCKHWKESEIPVQYIIDFIYDSEGMKL